MHTLEVILGVLVALCCRLRKPIGGGILILGNVLSQQVEFPKSVLRVLVSLLRRFRQPTNRVPRIFCGTLTA